MGLRIFDERANTLTIVEPVFHHLRELEYRGKQVANKWVGNFSHPGTSRGVSEALTTQVSTKPG